MENVMKNDITPPQLRAARGLLNWSRGDLAKAAGTTERTIARLEDGDSEPRVSTAQAIKNALEASGVEFTNGDAPGVRLLKPMRRKRRK
jgi:predicted transcriptional regulator